MANDFKFDLYQDLEKSNSEYPVYDDLKHTAKELSDSGVSCLLFLDFDGVINVFGNNTNFNYYQVDNSKEVMNVHYTPPLAWGDASSPRSFTIRWSSEMIEDLNKVCSSPSVQVISLTTWRQWMREPCELMGFKPAREVLTLQWGSDDPTSKLYYKQYYKGQALKEWLSQGTVSEQMSMVWVDDSILRTEHLAYRHGLPEPFFTEEKSLLIAPNELFGISRGEMQRMEYFVSGKQ